MIPRLAAREGDVVQRGDALFFHKFDPRVKVVAPAAGRVKAVVRGHRRVITDFVLTLEGDGDKAFRAWSLADLASISREDALEQVLDGGGWPSLRTRPLDGLADPQEVPQAILICATASGPLEPGSDVLLRAEDKDALQAAVHVLKAISGGPVYLSTREGDAHPALSGLQGATVHTFSGPHPSGDPGVQINLIAPPSAGGKVLYIHAWDAAAIGRLFLTGKVDGERVYAAVGTGVVKPRFVRTLAGAPVAHITGDVGAGPMRHIVGTVLTGQRTEREGYMGLFTRTLHVLADEVPVEMFGWALPKLSRWSAHKAYLSGFSKATKVFDMRPGLFGGHRAIVPTGIHSTVVATPDIEPTFLFKSIIAGDVERAIELGMLDITEEEAALCAFICPSKIDYDVILREGLASYAKEA